MPRSIHVLIMFIHLVHEHLSEAHSWQYIDTSSKGLSVSTPLVGGAETQAPFATFIKVRQLMHAFIKYFRVYLRKYLVGRQWVGRPICVCAALAPLRRVNI